MPNKDYSEEFFKEYTPKNPEDIDSGRDLSSYSKPETHYRSEPPKRRTTSSATAPKRTSQRPPQRKASSTPKKMHKASSYLKSGERVAKGVINKYGEICMVNLGTIVKIIAFVVAFFILIVSLALGIMLFASRSGLSAMSLLVIVAGAVTAAVVFFPIYGIGHIIAQNNEILRIFTDQTNK